MSDRGVVRANGRTTGKMIFAVDRDAICASLQRLTKTYILVHMYIALVPFFYFSKEGMRRGNKR